MQTDGSVRPGIATSPIGPGLRALAWGLLSFIGFIAIFSVLVWPVSQLEQALGLPHPVALGIWALTWMIGSGLLALAAARLVFGQWLVVHGTAWVILLLGAVLSAALVTVLADWAIGRYGFNESDLVGPMSLLFGIVGSIAVAGFGVQVAPRGAAWSPLLALAAGAVIGTAILLSNIPGLADGLGRDSGPLAAVTVAAALYIGAVAILSLARLRRG